MYTHHIAVNNANHKQEFCCMKQINNEDVRINRQNKIHILADRQAAKNQLNREGVIDPDWARFHGLPCMTQAFKDSLFQPQYESAQDAINA
jgi:hypothetical protein